MLGDGVDFALHPVGEPLDEPFDRRADDPREAGGEAGTFQLRHGAGEEGEIVFRDGWHVGSIRRWAGSGEKFLWKWRRRCDYSTVLDIRSYRTD